MAAIMVGLVMVGLGLATASPSLAPRYWLWLVPVFGLLSVLTAWIGSPDSPRLGLRAVGRQLLHWLVIGGAVALDFWLRGTGEEAGVTAGFDALLLLAVGCFRFPPLAAGDICMAGTPNSRPYSLGIVRHVVTFGALVVTMSSCQRRSQTTRLPSGARGS